MTDGVAGIVLAGGAGRRLGGPKGLVEVGGATLATRAAEILRPWCDEVVIVTRPDVPITAPDCRTVFDRPGPAAPLAAIATGLAAVDADLCLVLACDLPLAGSLVERLMAAAPGPAAVAVDVDGTPQPLCARYRRVAATAASEALLAGGELRAQALPSLLGYLAVPAHGDELRNINTPDDLQAARRRLDAHRTEG